VTSQRPTLKERIYFAVLKLVGEAVNIMCQVNPKYEKFVVIENGKKVLYLQLLKALYGCVQSALLWYNLFTNTLVRMGFKLNPYGVARLKESNALLPVMLTQQNLACG